MLRLTGISKSFLQRGIVLNNLNLEINEGDSIAITGPSGSGKTTLMNIIGLLDRPDTGDIVFREKSILGYSADDSAIYRNLNVGFVFQDHLLLPYLTVKENIMLPLFARIISDDEYSEKEVFAQMLMSETGIDSIKDKYPFHISGGEAQRVSLVRALINKPSLLLADEPTGSLDSANANLLGDLLVKMNKDLGITLLVTTHSQKLASKMKFHMKLENGKLKHSREK
jgi:ABC-type antimicrobial peptide transport system, ATPase component